MVAVGLVQHQAAAVAGRLRHRGRDDRGAAGPVPSRAASANAATRTVDEDFFMVIPSRPRERRSGAAAPAGRPIHRPRARRPMLGIPAPAGIGNHRARPPLRSPCTKAIAHGRLGGQYARPRRVGTKPTNRVAAGETTSPKDVDASRRRIPGGYICASGMPAARRRRRDAESAPRASWSRLLQRLRVEPRPAPRKTPASDPGALRSTRGRRAGRAVAPPGGRVRSFSATTIPHPPAP